MSDPNGRPLLRRHNSSMERIISHLHATRAQLAQDTTTLNISDLLHTVTRGPSVDKEALRAEREANECPSLQISRSCKICFFVSPRLRAVYIGCGHIVCEPCAKEQSLTEEKCPVCRMAGSFIRLFEEEKRADEVDESNAK